MMHIGYISELSNGVGIIIDAQHKAHCFVRDGKEFVLYQFVTYEGEDELVKDVTLLESYPFSSGARSYRKEPFYIQDGVGSMCKYYIVSKTGERYGLKGAEAYIVDIIVNRNKKSHSDKTNLSLEDFTKEIKTIYSKVEYVSSHIKKIADSYHVEFKVSHNPKIGGDDRFYVNRVVSIEYFDNYIARFFKKGERIYEESGYSSNFEMPDFIKKEMEENDDLAKQTFMSKYNMIDHLSFLIYEFINSIAQQNNNIRAKNNILKAYWPMGEERGEYLEDPYVAFRWKILINVSDIHSIDEVIEQTRLYNNRTTMKYMGNVLE